MNQTIESRVLCAVAKVKNITQEDIRLDQLIEDVCNNSLDYVELMIELEVVFGESIAMMTTELSTIQDLVDEIEKIMTV